jgi:hypothetical protein
MEGDYLLYNKMRIMTEADNNRTLVSVSLMWRPRRIQLELRISQMSQTLEHKS